MTAGVGESGGYTTSLKYISLFVLTFQNAGQVLAIRYARTRETKDMFLPSTAVFWTEIIKLISCLIVVTCQEQSVLKCLKQAYDAVIRHPVDTLKVCVPSFIYTVQNNLLYVAVSHLDAASFMVTYQLKILTTALFAVILLNKPLSKGQWLSLLILFVGVSIVQLQDQKSASPSTKDIPKLTNDSLKIISATNSQQSPISAGSVSQSEVRTQKPLIGLLAVVVACLMSGFAGVYFEKILKNSGEISVWMRNIQLAVLSIPISYCTMMIQDGPVVHLRGLLYGYDNVVWGCVSLYALGGLTVAVVVKYADNILKGFATSISIILSTVVSMFLFKYMPTMQFTAGGSLVIVSVYLYSKTPYKKNNVGLTIIAQEKPKEIP